MDVDETHVTKKQKTDDTAEQPTPTTRNLNMQDVAKTAVQSKVDEMEIKFNLLKRVEALEQEVKVIMSKIYASNV